MSIPLSTYRLQLHKDFPFSEESLKSPRDGKRQTLLKNIAHDALGFLAV